MDIATLAADAGHTPNAEPPTPQRSARERTPGMLIEFVLVIVLALCNGFFALSEMALMTARRSRIKQLARDSRRAQAALDLMQQPEGFLATVQVFITLLQISAGAALGADIGDRIGIALDAFDLPWLDRYSMAIGVSLSVAGITFLNMLLGELGN
jgi:putative hemolysin